MTSTDRSRLRAVLFDIDGTLVDSNYLHVDAWISAFADVDRYPDSSAVHTAIGLDSAKLLARLLGEDAADDVIERAKDRHAQYYEAAAPRLRRFDGVHELFRELRRRGLKIVLASSSPADELEKLLAVLEVDDLVDATTGSADVETAKPEPDLIETALERAGVAAEEALMVGDTRWDAEAAARAGVSTIGVLTGGRSAQELTDAGAIAVFDSPADLLARIDDSPIG